jgi:hypothetical protein
MATELINGVYHVTFRENGGGGGGGTDMEAVHFTPQSLTPEQKLQARTNIGSGTYSKPNNGIPLSDLESGVVPPLSTSVSDDATSDTKVSTPKSVKTYVDGIVGNINTILESI